MFRSLWMSYFFWLWGLVYYLWSLILKHISVFVFKSSFWNNKCCYLLFYSYPLSFIKSIFDVRSYNGSYMSCPYAPCLNKFTTFIDESVSKNKLISSSHGRFKTLLAAAVFIVLSAVKEVFDSRWPNAILSHLTTSAAD